MKIKINMIDNKNKSINLLKSLTKMNKLMKMIKDWYITMKILY